MSKHHWSTGYCHYDDMLAAHLSKAGLWKKPGGEISLSQSHKTTPLYSLCAVKKKEEAMSIIIASQIAKFWRNEK